MCAAIFPCSTGELQMQLHASLTARQNNSVLEQRRLPVSFQTPQHALKDLLPRISRGDVQLPDFQRGYVWADEDIRSLLVTISHGHPLGVVMTLQTGNDEVRFKPTPLEGAAVKPGEVEPSLLVLDGQQRLTSISQALSNSGIVHTQDARKKIVDRRYYIDIQRAVSNPKNLDEAIRSLPADGILRENFDRDIKLDVSTREKQLDHGLFPLSLVYQDEAMSWVMDYRDRVAVEGFMNTILMPMRSYAIPSIELDRNTGKDAVATVFEKVNQGGVRLTVFELLTAKFAGDAHYFSQHDTDFRLKDDWTSTQAIIEMHPVLRGLEQTEFLQAVTLLASHARESATTARKDDVLDLELSDYLAWAPKVRESMTWVAGFLDAEHIHTARDLPYPTQLVPLAVIRTLLGPEADVWGVSARIREWYWCGVLGELYSAATESRFARDVDQVPDWARGRANAAIPRTVEDAAFRESRLHSLRTRNAAAYKGIHALLMRNDARDWLHNQKFDRAHYLNLAVDIHHIFPKKWCLAHDVPQYKRESIVNKTPLARKTNQIIGGASPAEYMPKIDHRSKIDSGEVDAIVTNHLIDVGALRSGDFARFFAQRREALVALVEQAMGKTASRDIDEFGGGSESAAAYADEDDDLDDLDNDLEGEDG